MKKFAKNYAIVFFAWRFYVVSLVLAICFVGLLVRMIDLTVINRNFLLKQGNARSLRVVSDFSLRGIIRDRHEKPLAISTPVFSVWINPQEFVNNLQNVENLGRYAQIAVDEIKKLLIKNQDREFFYLKRGLTPEDVAPIRALKLEGVYLQREFRRYYPAANATSHLLGFTNIDDDGQEGLELAFNQMLKGEPSKRVVIKDRLGHVVKEIEKISDEVPGKDLILSIDERLQSTAAQALKETVDEFAAKAGSIVVLDVNTGEVLAMVNQPDYNPNDRSQISPDRFRNRAVTDSYEPGSVMKTFAIVSGLDSGRYQPDSLIDTDPGWIAVGRNIVRDEHHSYSQINLAQILQKSSNVGIAKVTLSLPPERLREVLLRFGFGRSTGSEYPGESSGYLVNYVRWPSIAVATLSFGYGVSVTTLQLAHAYSIIANGGIDYPVTFLRRDQAIQGKRVLSAHVAQQTLELLQSVMQQGGTGLKANVAGYRVAGKTGTARMASAGGYDKRRHIASFVGIAPASHPRLVVAVVIFEPHQKDYYGGAVAGPAFVKVMADALHMLRIPPDQVDYAITTGTAP